ncbi:IS3 family transposase [Legionella drozanskii]
MHGEKFATRTAAKNHIFAYIEIYYNRKRLHSKLAFQTLTAFEVKWVA